MEIDKAIRESSDRRLQTKYKNATYVIERAFALYEFEQVAFSFNGGKDSTVLLHLLRAGYYLHEEKMKQSTGNQFDCMPKCPIRTIYFESPCTFPEINSFTYETATNYDLQLEVICLDFKSGLETLLMEKPTKAIFLGTRIGDPNAVGQEQFSPSSPGWPPFMRVNPILDWSYRDVWAFLLTCKVQYCSLYDKGYTSIGSMYDTIPNQLLSIPDSSGSKDNFKPAYLLPDGRLERAGRAKKLTSKCDTPGLSNGLNNVNPHQSSSLSASVIAVGDEILYGTVNEPMGTVLCKNLCSIGWLVTHFAVVRNEVDSVAEEVERWKPTNDLVFLFGGVGPLHSDISVAGVAKAFGVRLAPDEEFEEYLRHLIGDQRTGDQNEMALLPEGITELLHHEKLPVPLIKCHNVIIFSATNVSELETEWDCLMELPSTPMARMAPFISKHLSTTLSDVETAESISKLCFDFPDIHISCHRKSRVGPLVISFIGKMSLAEAKRSLVADGRTNQQGLHDKSPNNHYFDSEDTTSQEFKTPESTPAKQPRASAAVLPVNSNGTRAAVSHMAKEFEQKKKDFEDDARLLIEVKSGQSPVIMNPDEELQKLKVRFVSWKKDYKVKLREAKAELQKIGNLQAVKPRRRWWSIWIRR